MSSASFCTSAGARPPSAGGSMGTDVLDGRVFALVQAAWQEAGLDDDVPIVPIGHPVGEACGEVGKDTPGRVF